MPEDHLDKGLILWRRDYHMAGAVFSSCPQRCSWPWTGPGTMSLLSSLFDVHGCKEGALDAIAGSLPWKSSLSMRHYSSHSTHSKENLQARTLLSSESLKSSRPSQCWLQRLVFLAAWQASWRVVSTRANAYTINSQQRDCPTGT